MLQDKNIFIAQPINNEQIKALKAVLIALNVPFQIREEISYIPTFVAKIHKSRKQYQSGKFTRIKNEDINTLLGL